MALLPAGGFLAVPVQAQGGNMGSWKDDPFWTVFVAHSRAELMFRRFEYRFCAFPDDKPGVHGARRNMRASLDAAKARIDSIWPGRRERTFDAFASRDATPVERCDDPVAAEESFAAALMAVDSVEFVLEALQRERRAGERN